MFTRFLAALAALLALGVVSACGGGSDAAEVAADQATVTTAPSSTQPLSTLAPLQTTMPEETTTSTVPGSTTSTVASACPEADLPSGATSAPVNADVDGDGAADLAYVVDNRTLVVELGGGGAVIYTLAGVGGPTAVRALGGADLMGDGTDEVAVVTGGGAYAMEIGFVRFRDCELFELAFEDSSPARFLSGASVANGEALFCRGDGTIERYFWSIINGSDDADPEFEGGFAPYEIVGDVVVSFPGDGAVITSTEVAAIELFDGLGLVL